MHGFSWFEYLFGKLGVPIHVCPENEHFFTAGLVALLIAVGALLTWSKVRNVEEALIPSGSVCLRNLFELTVGSILRLMEDLIGEKAQRYFPLIGSLFIYIFACNVIGLIPGFVPPTSNIYINFGCALVVFFYYNYVGFKENGLKYIKHFIGPIFWLAPIMLPIELISNLVRPLSLSVRLFGNMTGDHMVLEMFSDLVPLVVPVAFMFLTLFVAFIQAFVFSLLSTMYIALAIEH